MNAKLKKTITENPFIESSLNITAPLFIIDINNPKPINKIAKFLFHLNGSALNTK